MKRIAFLPIPFLPIGTLLLPSISKIIGGASVFFLSLLVLLVIFNTPANRSTIKLTAIASVILTVGFLGFLFSPYKSIPAFLFDAQFFSTLILLTLYFSFFKISEIDFEKHFIRAMLLSFAFFILDCGLLVASGGSILFYDLGVYRFSPGLGPSAGSIYLLALIIPMLCFSWPKANKIRIFLCLLIMLMIIATGTRITMIAMMSIVLYFLWKKGHLGLNAMGLVICLLFSLAGYNVLQRLFFEGGRGLGAINMNGRLEIWSSLLDEGVKSYLIGNGFGAAYSYITSTGVGLGIGVQPHNDYIKIFFNTGVFGLALFILLSATIWRETNDSMKKSNISPKTLLATRMYMIGLLILMLTDNVIIYHFYIYPAILLITYCIATKNRYRECT